MRSFARFLGALLAIGCAGIVAAAAVFVGCYYYVEPGLPQAEELRDVQLSIPMQVYSRDGRLIQEFGAEKRTPVDYEQIPAVVIQALIAAEDDAFFEHPGLDVLATGKAVVNYILSNVASGGERVPGGSTITQQVAREYFLSRDYSAIRKFKEVILALRIEREFTKEEILELFFNTTFFGQHSYGVVVAAQTYFGKSLDELTLSDAAILAGIPQGPSIMNPISSPENAANRRAYVLRRMRELRFIDDRAYQQALEVPITGERHGLEMELNAPYVAEMVRSEMIRRFGQETAYTTGLKVTTTLDSRHQAAADRALRAGVIAYDERHGYRGPIGRLDVTPEQYVRSVQNAGGAEGGDEAEASSTEGTSTDGTPTQAASTEAPTMARVSLPAEYDEARLRDALVDHPVLVGLEAAVVESVSPAEATVYLLSRGRQSIGLPAVQWAARQLSNGVGARPQTVSEVLQPGDIVRFRWLEDGTLRLAQLPEVQAAFVSIDPQDGAITALSGGFDYYLDKFNRATQAKRQPGSAFKPFIFSAALEHGFTAATMVLDAPLTIEDPGLETAWKPANYSNTWVGPVSLRETLKRSINSPVVRVIQQVGVTRTVRHLRQFGFGEDALPANESLALGTGGIAPVDLAGGYAAFANGGFRVQPYFIDRIENAFGEVIPTARPPLACGDCEVAAAEASEPPQLSDDVADLYPPMRLAPRAITPQNAFLVADMMKSVMDSGGTGNAARRELGRRDLAGKTGTTDDRRDAWFAGFGGDVVAVSWVGFNNYQELGGSEQGAVTALPIWIDFMREALEGVPERAAEAPPGIVSIRIDPRTGLAASASNPNTIEEKFRIGHEPEREPDDRYQPPRSPNAPSEDTSPSKRLF